MDDLWDPFTKQMFEKTAMYEEVSVCTFRSHAQDKPSATSEKISVSFGKPTIIADEAHAPAHRSQSVPSAVHESTNEDGSVLRMSDSMTK